MISPGIIKRKTAMAVLACLMVTLSGCSHDTSSAAGRTVASGAQLKIAMNVYSRTLPYFQEIIRGVQDVAHADGRTTVDVTYGDTDPQLQFEQLENALSTVPNGLIVLPVDQSALIPVIQQAATNGVPVVTLANDLDKAGHQFQLAYVGQNYVDIGRQKARYMVDALHGHGTVGYIHGIRGLTFSELQAQGAMEVFKAAPGITVIDGPYAGQFSSDAGLRATENVLTATPAIDALYFDNDDIALGGILAVQQRGRPVDSIVIIGTDGGEPALNAIAAGTLDMTISLCGYASGRVAAAKLIDNLRNGTKPNDRFVPVEALMITKSNLADARAKISAGKC